MKQPDAGLIDPPPNHRLDAAALDAFLLDRLEDYGGRLRIEQFAGGQSNPTYLLSTPRRRYVLRKKPPGKLLPSAHQVEREHRVYEALQTTDVPVPQPYLLCDDPAIIGTPFYIMEYIEGRVFRDEGLRALDAAARRAVYAEMNRVLAVLHNVDYVRQGLGDYGKPGNYFVRQIGRWSKQYVAAKTHDIPSMDRLMDWLPANVPEEDTTTLVHGDYQLYNLLYHPSEPRVLAVLDWELSTLGHPLADLAYNCMKYHATLENRRVTPGDGVPTEEEFVAEYCRRTTREAIANWNFYLAFSFFRMASIIQGVYKRGLQGNASSSEALGMKAAVAETSRIGWALSASGDTEKGSR